MSKSERIEMARQIEQAADRDGVLQAEDVLRIAPARAELHRSTHMTSLADALGVRDELDQIAG